MRYLVENPDNGERQHVQSLDGYKGWTILARGRNSEPKEHHHFENGRWVHDPEAERASRDEAILTHLTRKELKDLIKEIMLEINTKPDKE
jgi:hypothetical protein